MLDIIIISSIIAMPVVIALYGVYLLVKHLRKGDLWDLYE